MVKTYQIKAFTYLARQDGQSNGMVKAYEVYLSTDGKNWGSPVASGEFKNTTALQVATFSKSTAGRYLKFVAKSEINGKAWSSAAEIGIEAEADITGVSAAQQEIVIPDDTIYDMQGRPMMSHQTASNNHLPTGMYIHKRKKMLITQNY